MGWKYAQATKFKSSFPKYRKRHEGETTQCVVNLDTYQAVLESGKKPGTFKLGFMHLEPHGVLAIDQSGMEGSGRETRLYVYPDEMTETIYLITIGDKNSQKPDIRLCTEFVRVLKKEQEDG